MGVRCPKCSRNIVEHYRFCPYCGSPTQPAISDTAIIKKFQIRLAIVSAWGGASLGALLGMCGKRGTSIVYLGLMFVTGYWVREYLRRSIKSGKKPKKVIKDIGYKKVTNVMLGVLLLTGLLWVTYRFLPIAGGILSGALTTLIIMRIFVEKIFLYPHLSSGCLAEVTPQDLTAFLVTVTALSFLVFVITVIAGITGIWIGFTLLTAVSIVVYVLSQWGYFRR